MSKLDELIAELCPNGVEYKTLQDITKAVNIGINPRKFFKLNPEGAKGFYVTVRELNGLQGVKQCDKTDLIDLDAVKIINDRANIEIGDILFSNTGTVGKMALVIEPPNNWGVNEGIYVIKPKNEIIESKFLYYFLSGKEAYNDYSSKFTGSTLKHVTQAALLSLSIPVPPLPIQQEIVRILDNFTELTAELTTELTAELEARQKQYEYYRDKLLSFKEVVAGGQTGKLGKLIAEFCPEGVEYKRLGEIGYFYGGLSGKSKYDFANGNAKFITYMNVYSNLAVDTEISEMVKIGENEKQNTVKHGDILFTGSSETLDECGISSVLTKETNEKLYLNSFCFGFRLIDKDLLLPDFSKYLFRSKEIRKQIKRTASGVTRFNVSKKKMEQVVIPVPPLPIQQEIVRILDNFTELTAELTTKLTTELEARQKQYEYYRDKLLSFKEATA
jgi:type I restriction enzyme S subunit